MRRKNGELIPIEISILQTAIDLRMRGEEVFHGFLIARQIKEREDSRLLTAHGTLYKALDRLQRLGFLESEWEEPQFAADEGRPRRRLYRVTAAGETALARSRFNAPRMAATRPGFAAS